MGLFKDEQEVYKYQGKIFQLGVDDPELGEKFRAVGVVIRINYTDPVATITTDFGNGVVEFGSNSTLQPDIEMSMTTDIGHKFWLGKVNVAMAIAKGQMKTRGPVPKVMKLVPITKPLFTSYEKVLRDDGREDLIAAAG